MFNYNFVWFVTIPIQELCFIPTQSNATFPHRCGIGKRHGWGNTGANNWEYIYSHFMFGMQFYFPLVFIVPQWSSLKKELLYAENIFYR
jgi:hypothetical protein